MTFVPSIVSGFVASAVPHSDAIIVTASQLAARAVEVKNCAFMESNEQQPEQIQSTPTAGAGSVDIEYYFGQDEWKGQVYDENTKSWKKCDARIKLNCCKTEEYIYFETQEGLSMETAGLPKHIKEFVLPKQCGSTAQLRMKLCWMDKEDGSLELDTQALIIEDGKEDYEMQMTEEVHAYLANTDIASDVKGIRHQKDGGVSITVTTEGEDSVFVLAQEGSEWVCRMTKETQSTK